MAAMLSVGGSFSLAFHRTSSRFRRKSRRIRASYNGVATSTLEADREEAAAQLVQWLVQKGAIAPNQLSSVRIEHGPRGLGLYASRSISKGQELVSIPKSVWMDSNAVKESDIGEFCTGLKPWVAVALLLIHERSKPSSDWQPYIRVLPQSLDSPLFWSDKELAELKGTQLLSSVTGFKLFIEREFNKVVEEVIKPRSDVFNIGMFTLEAFTWAFGVLRSRTFPPLVGENLALVPLADFVNHGSTLTNEDPSWKQKSASIFSRQECLSLESPANYKQNEEILMQYGKKKANSQLAVDYGFVDYSETSTRDSFALTLQISESDRFADDKADIAELQGLNTTSYFTLARGSGPPEDMLAFLRLIALAGTDSFLLEALFRNTAWDHLRLPVSRDNEEAICEAMIEGCRATLRDYGTTVEEDIKLLESGALTSRRKLAVVVRLGEKRILQEQLQWFETHLADLDRLEYYAERRLRDLGLLDDKGNMTPWVFKS